MGQIANITAFTLGSFKDKIGFTFSKDLPCLNVNLSTNPEEISYDIYFSKNICPIYTYDIINGSVNLSNCDGTETIIVITTFHYEHNKKPRRRIIIQIE